MLIPINAANGCYDIVIERGSLKKAGEFFDLKRNVFIVTGALVPEKYAKTVAGQCEKANIYILPSGEKSKCFKELEGILGAMVDAGLTRGDCVVAVGGGVVGDISAFAASCYMRGIDFYNIPTTLLSQVDSSVGGKTGIDFKGVKNIVGSFYQPKGVLIDPDVLETLDDRQIHAGLAEAIKMAVTFDKELFELIENSEDLNSDLMEIIYKALKIKANVVEQDPKEQGIRKVLNFGHTIGHGIEAKHQGELLHGECVALGMIPMCAPKLRERLINVLKKYDLPTETEDSFVELSPFIIHDKKMKNGRISVVYSQNLGSFELREYTPEDIKKLMEGTT